MAGCSKYLCLAALLLAAVSVHEVRAEKRTVCTITVNSPEEKEAFRRYLPSDKFQFVELVERGRPDWLASACSRGVRCDVLVVSGHYDGGNEFFSDRLEKDEFLPVEELERVSCSDGCPGLFSNLKEVYLFGCNTLNAEAVKSVSGEIERSLLRSGHSRADAQRLSRSLHARHGESSRDRMRLIFKDVPVLYGFSSVAPLGPVAGSILDRYFQAAGPGEVGRGRVSPRLTGRFASHSMVFATGLSETDPLALHRQQVCRFADDRQSLAHKLDFIHELVRRNLGQVRMHLDRIEKVAAAVGGINGPAPELSAALGRIAADNVAREAYLTFARDADERGVRARMMEVARDLGWLSATEKRAEIMRMIGEMLGGDTVNSADVDLVCSLNAEDELSSDRHLVEAVALNADRATHSAVLACLGSETARARVLRALISADDHDVRVAQVYLRHRPIEDVNELRGVIAGIVLMSPSAAKIRALETLGHHRLSDPDSLAQLTRLFPVAESPDVQSAIAGVLIRSDYTAIASDELLHTLRQHRLPSANGRGPVDVLIRRLQAQ